MEVDQWIKILMWVRLVDSRGECKTQREAILYSLCVKHKEKHTNLCMLEIKKQNKKVIIAFK